MTAPASTSAGDGPMPIPQHVLEWMAFSDLPPLTFRLLAWLLLSADQETGEINASQKEIAAALGTRRQNVNAAMRALVDRGIVESRRRLYKVSAELLPGSQGIVFDTLARKLAEEDTGEFRAVRFDAPNTLRAPLRIVPND